MRGKIKKRIVLPCALLVAGFAIASMATVFGAGSLLIFEEKEIGLVAVGGKLRVCEDDHVVRELNIQEREYIVERSGNGLKLCRVMEATPETKEKINESIEIANRDSRIRELTNDNGLRQEIADTAVINGNEIKLTVKIGDKCYEIVVDLENETVKSIKEIEALRIRIGPHEVSMVEEEENE
ncbi:MAG: hypothetical protein J7L20_03780 [Thermoplasmata archaeon]|nr:hypothetical protein [Thermoplasmata archaeon]